MRSIAPVSCLRLGRCTPSAAEVPKRPIGPMPFLPRWPKQCRRGARNIDEENWFGTCTRSGVIHKPAIYVIRGHKVMLDVDLAQLLWGADQATQRAGQAQPQAVSPGLYFPAHNR